MLILESAGAGGELPTLGRCYSSLTITLGNELKLLGFEIAAWQQGVKGKVKY